MSIIEEQLFKSDIKAFELYTNGRVLVNTINARTGVCWTNICKFCLFESQCLPKVAY